MVFKKMFKVSLTNVNKARNSYDHHYEFEIFLGLVKFDCNFLQQILNFYIFEFKTKFIVHLQNNDPVFQDTQELSPINSSTTTATTTSFLKQQQQQQQKQQQSDDEPQPNGYTLPKGGFPMEIKTETRYLML